MQRSLKVPAGARSAGADSARAGGGLGRGDLPGAARVPGDADERAAGGDAAVGRVCWRCSGLGRRSGAGGCCRGRCSELLALVRPEYLAIAVLVALCRPRRELRRRLARRSLLRAAVFLGAAWWSSSPPGRSATRSRSIASCRSRPAAARCSSPAPTCPRTEIRKRSARRSSRENPDLFATRRTPRRLRLGARSSPASPRDRYPEHGNRPGALEARARNSSGTTSRRSLREYAGFVATKVWRIWSHGPRDVMQEPVWEALHWPLVAFGLLGLAILAWRRRWEALLIGTIFLAITALSALLVASPRRVLVLVPLLAALASVVIARLVNFRTLWRWKIHQPHPLPRIAWAGLDRPRRLDPRAAAALRQADADRAGDDRVAGTWRCAPMWSSSRSSTPATTRAPTTRSRRPFTRSRASAGPNSRIRATGHRAHRSSTPAAFYATGGAREGTARIVEALLGVATILVAFALGWRLGGRDHGRWVGLFAAFAVAVYPPFIHSTGVIMSEPPAMLTLPAAVLAFLWASERERVLGLAPPRLPLRPDGDVPPRVPVRRRPPSSFSPRRGSPSGLA